MKGWLALPIALALAAAGFAAADETRPDCEPGQPNPLQGSGLFYCEGEHWDGQDPTPANGFRYGIGEPTPPTESEPMHAGARGDASDPTRILFIYWGARGVGELAVYASREDGTIALYARDGTDFLVAGSAVEPALAALSAALGRGDAGADGNAVAWLAALALDAAPASGLVGSSSPGEGDCGASAYDAGSCTRDNTAITLVVPALARLP